MYIDLIRALFIGAGARTSKSDFEAAAHQVNFITREYHASIVPRLQALEALSAAPQPIGEAA